MIIVSADLASLNKFLKGEFCTSDAYMYKWPVHVHVNKHVHFSFKPVKNQYCIF